MAGRLTIILPRTTTTHLIVEDSDPQMNNVSDYIQNDMWLYPYVLLQSVTNCAAEHRVGGTDSFHSFTSLNIFLPNVASTEGPLICLAPRIVGIPFCRVKQPLGAIWKCRGRKHARLPSFSFLWNQSLRPLFLVRAMGVNVWSATHCQTSVKFEKKEVILALLVPSHYVVFIVGMAEDVCWIYSIVASITFSSILKISR
jgi:hypothetical protein